MIFTYAKRVHDCLNNINFANNTSVVFTAFINLIVSYL